MRVGGASFMVTMRTPGHDVELATGFLFSEGIIRSREHVRQAMHCTPRGEVNTYNVLDLTLTVPPPPPKRFTTTSACGVCGKDSIDEVRTSSQFDIFSDDEGMDPEVLLTLPEKLRKQQEVFSSTGGTHAAGLFTYSGEAIVIREDVGRHNAVDKVIGWAVMNSDMPLRKTVLQVSGRASFELVQKAAMAGIAMMGAVSAPSSLAVDVARETGVTLAGFMRGEQFNVYTHGQRLGA